MPRILLVYRDTTGADYTTMLCDVDLAGGDGVAGKYLPSTARFESQALLIPNANIRYLAVQVGLYGESGAAVTMAVDRVDIRNISA
jgi:hypothetical protein